VEVEGAGDGQFRRYYEPSVPHWSGGGKGNCWTNCAYPRASYYTSNRPSSWRITATIAQALSLTMTLQGPVCVIYKRFVNEIDRKSGMADHISYRWCAHWQTAGASE
jgi:hypothetical protein